MSSELEQSSTLPISHTILHENDTYTARFCYRGAGMALLIHVIHLLFGPISLLCMRSLFGATLVRNMRMGRGRIYALDFAFHVYVLALIPFLYYKETRLEFCIEAVYAVAVMFVRYFVIFIKYGSLTHRQWKDLKSSVLSWDALQPFRIENWARLNQETAFEEIRYAFSRQPVDLPSIPISFTLPVSDYSAMERGSTPDPLDTRSQILEPGQTSLSALTAAERLVEVVCNDESPRWVTYCYAASGVFSVLPFLVRLYSFGLQTLRLSPDEVVFSVVTMAGCWYTLSHFLRFLAVGLTDLERKLSLLQACVYMCSWCSKQARLPKVDFSKADTAVGMYYLRRSFFEFGVRYSKRVHLYAALMLPVSVLIVMYVLLQAMKLIPTGNNLLLLPAFYLSLSSDVFLCQMILIAVRINNTFLVQRDLMLEAVARLNQREKKCKLKEDAVKRLLWVEKKLEQDQHLRPMKILGVAISQGFVNKLAALAASGVFAIVQLNS